MIFSRINSAYNFIYNIIKNAVSVDQGRAVGFLWDEHIEGSDMVRQRCIDSRTSSPARAESSQTSMLCSTCELGASVRLRLCAFADAVRIRVACAVFVAEDAVALDVDLAVRVDEREGLEAEDDLERVRPADDGHRAVHRAAVLDDLLRAPARLVRPHLHMHMHMHMYDCEYSP